MSKGPILNDISKNFTTRDSLGIEGVVTSFQGDICPIVNTVTPRAFYWPFMIWIYYDFYKNSGIKAYTDNEFNSYLKRQDYFFVLATLLNDGSDRERLVGTTQSQIDINNNKTGKYVFNPNYFQTRHGGMFYYNAGCLSMYFITDKDSETGKDLGLPILTKEGERMALAFEKVIRDTDYYKYYRVGDKPVPEQVLKDYGKVIHFGLKGFDECKHILKKYMFNDDRASQLIQRSQLLTDCAEYIKLLIENYKVKTFSNETLRLFLFDKYTENGEEIIIPEKLQTVSNKWEITIAREYIVIGIEMIWKYMLEMLNSPLDIREWIGLVLDKSSFEIGLDSKLKDIIGECNFNFTEREKMISEARLSGDGTKIVENGLKMIFSIYNRLKKRDDFGEEKAFYDYGNDRNSLSLTEMIEIIDEFNEKSIEEFLVYIMKEWLIYQHYYTAVEKLLYNRDGFYYEIVNGKYIKKHDFSIDFQGNRLLSLKQIMIDLDMLHMEE